MIGNVAIIIILINFYINILCYRYYHTALITTHYCWGCSGEGPVPTFHRHALLNNTSMFND